MAKKKSTAQKQKTESVSLEDALAELETITADLESGTDGLDESITRFERGMQLLKNCHQKLDAAARRIEVVTRINEDGNVETKPFQEVSTFDAAASITGDD